MRLTHRLILFSVIVVSALIAVVAVIIDYRVGARMSEEMVSELAREARLVSTQWASGSNAFRLSHTAGAALGHRVTLIRSDGVVGGDSEFDSIGVTRLENHFARPEVVAARKSGIGSSRRFSPSRGDEELYVAVAAPQGVARVSVSTKLASEIISRARRDVLFAGAAALVIATLLALLFAQNVSRPITELRDRARALADNDFTKHPPVAAPGEVGELAATLAQLSERLEALESTRRDFVANVSHELRTPITVIGGFAETLQDPDLAAAQRGEFVGIILANTRRMQRIVDELLDLSRIESGGWVPRPLEFDLDALVAEVIALESDTASKKSLDLIGGISPNASNVYADRTGLRQILTNLVENSIRHTSSGSITIFSSREGTGTTVGVRDTGEGISAEHLPRIFERFYRVDTGRSRASGGTGLGLSIVRHLTEAHGGHVRAESVVGGGTSIAVWFPDRATV
ncbi:MAG: HAMP domain-containing protein [Gemmatimonadaceae bacterium]|nr:HAMP domain-containing protein [Gemmatimonadaceae bacterium]